MCVSVCVCVCVCERESVCVYVCVCLDHFNLRAFSLIYLIANVIFSHKINYLLVIGAKLFLSYCVLKCFS